MDRENEKRVEKIIKRIEENSKRNAGAIIKEAEEKVSEIIKTAEEDSREVEDNIIQAASKEAELEKQRTIANAKLRARKMKLDAKEEAIKEAFRKAEKMLDKISNDSEYPQILENLIKESSLSIGSGDLEILLREEDRRLVKLDKIAEKVGKETNKLRLSISPDGIKSLGVVVRTKDGKVEVDNTFGTRLDRMRAALRSKVAKVLF